MSPLPAARPLSELGPLDPALLHVFVVGPGTGEGIAVALPGRGWMLIDGCRCDGPETLPLRAIVERWQRATDGVEAMILTHPHEDHAKGIAELMDAFAPAVVGLTGIEPTADGGLDMTRFVRTPGLFRSRRSAVYQALLAIDALRAAHPERVRFLAAPQPLALTHGGVGCRVCAPSADALPDVWPDGDPRPSANPLSVVLALTFGASEVILAADLPRSRSGGGLVATGWAEVMQREPRLADHTGLKLPHHGSNEAIDDALMAPPPRPRAWVVTPFASQDLPREDVFDGLLGRQSPIHLTAPSQARRYQAAVEREMIRPIDRATLTAMMAGLRGPGLFTLGDQHVARGTGGNALDHVWCIAFDAEGRVVGRWGGPGACEIVAAA